MTVYFLGVILLNRGRMFVWSSQQAKRLLLGQEGQAEDIGAERYRNSWVQERSGERRRNKWAGDLILDIGAGDGFVTRVLAEAAESTHVTEASYIMQRKLRGKGYRVLDTWSWAEDSDSYLYNTITCLNVLDRCDEPQKLLSRMYSKLKPEGQLVVAIVLPFSPYVETGSADNLPSEDLPVQGSTIEEQVNSVAEDIFPAYGFELVRWSRLPYLCEGDLEQTFYWLSDVVMVFRKLK